MLRTAFHASLVAVICLTWGVVQAQTPPPVVVQPPNSLPQPTATPPKPETLPQAAPPQGLSLEILEQMAIAANPAVIRAAALVGAARGNWIQVGLLPNPMVGYNGQQIGSGGLAEQHGVQFSQEIVRGHKLRLNRAVADQEVSRAEQELAIQQQRVITDVRISFYQTLLAQRQIDVTDNLVRIGQQGVASVEALFRAKEASRADVLQAQLEVENAQIMARNARLRHDAAWRGLTAVIGNPHLPPQPLAGDAFGPALELDFQQVLARQQAASPEIAAAMTDISRARFMLDRARAEPIPNVSVQGLVNVIDNGIAGRTDGGISIVLPIPVFNKNQGAVTRAQHEIAAAEQALQKLEMGMQSRLAPVFERYASSKNQVERFRIAILPAAQESLNLTRQTYQVGEVGFLSLLNAQRTFSQTNLNYLEALRELRMAEVQIEGLLLRDSLGTGP